MLCGHTTNDAEFKKNKGIVLKIADRSTNGQVEARNEKQYKSWILLCCIQVKFVVCHIFLSNSSIGLRATGLIKSLGKRAIHKKQELIISAIETKFE